MADDIIITEFGADLSKFNTEVDKAAKSIDALDAEMQGAAKSGKDLSGNMGDAGKKVTILGEGSKKASTDVKDLGKSASGASGFFGSLKDKLNETFPIFGKVASGAKSLGTAIYTALGPIGIVVGAIVLAFAGLVKIFAGTQEGADKVAKVTAVLSSVFDRLLGVAQVLGKAVFDAFANPKKAVNDLWEAVKTNIVNRLEGLVDQWKFLGEVIAGVFTLDADRITQGVNGFGEATTRVLTGVEDLAGKAGAAFNKFGEEISKAADTGLRIAEIDRNLRALALSRAENEGRITRELEEQRAIVSDVTKSAAERSAAAEKFNALQKQLTAFETKRLDLEIERGNLAASTSDTLDEEKIRIAELVSAKEEANARELAAGREINNQINSLNKAAADKAIAESKRVAAERERDAQKLADDIVKANEKIAEVKAAPQEQARRAQLTPEELQVDDLSIQFQKQLEDAQEAFAQLKALKEGNAEAIAQIDAELAATEEAIVANKTAAIDKLEREQLKAKKELNDEKLQLIKDATQSEQDLEVEAINKKFDALEQAAKDVITDEEELNEILLELAKKRGEQLLDVDEEIAAKRTEANINSAQELLNSVSNLGSAILASEQQITDGKIENYNRQIEAQKKLGKDTTELEKKRDEEAKTAARRAYQLNKSFTLAQIAIDTARAIASLTSASAGNLANSVTAGAAGAAQFAAGIIQILANIAQAKALLQSKAPGLKDGDPRIGGTPDRPGRDGYLRWLDKDERVVTAKDNMQHWDLLEAVRKGKLEEWKAENMDPISLNFERIAKVPSTADMIAYNFAPMVNNYVEGNSNAVTLTMPKGHDRGIIRAHRESTREQRRTNDILESMTKRSTSTPSKRLW